ncbi:MAG: adenylate/guanylate cyclase domain-containing protein [Chloracidobacterium sp.]
MGFPKIIVTGPSVSGRVDECRRFPLVIGRATSSDVIISDERASRSHAKIEALPDGSYRLIDLESRNGTMLNDSMIAGSVRLRDGDTIVIGSHRLVFQLPSKTVDVRYDDKPLSGTVRLQNAAELLALGRSGDVTGKPSSSFRAVATPNPQDVTLSAKQLHLLEKRSQILSLFYDFNKRVAREFDIATIYAEVARQVFEISNAGRVIIGKIGADNLPTVEWGTYRDDLMRATYASVPISRTVIRTVMQERVSLLSRDMSNVKGTAILGVQSLMCVPMLGQEDTPLGVIYADSLHLDGFTEDDVDYLTGLASTVALTLENIMAHERLLHEAEARTAYRRFLPPHVVDQIMEDPDSLQLGGVNQVVTTMFADIRGFTTLSERKSPHEIVAILNNYFERAATAIFRHGGSLDKFIGDGIMALFGAPQPSDRDPVNAVQAAIALQEVIEQVNADLAAQGSDLRLSIGIGINTGEVTAGYIGSKLRTDYTVIGDAVNLAARLESNAKPGQILMGETTAQCLRALARQSIEFAEGEREFAFVPLGGMKVKGKLNEVKVYRVLWGEELATLGDTSESGTPPVLFRSATTNPVLLGSETIARTQLDWGTIRRDPRRQVSIPVVVTGADAHGNAFEQATETIDVSPSGACIRLAQPLTIPSSLSLLVPSYGWRGEVIVRKLTRDPQGYLVGVEIVGQGPQW